MTCRRLSLLTVLLAAAASLAGAAEPPQDKKDPQAAVEPRSAPGAGQKFLEKFAGDWDVVKTFHPRSGDPVSAKGECKQAMIHDGRFLESKFVFHGDRGKSTGTGLIGFEASSGKFTSVWTDSRSTRMSLRQGKDKFNGEEIVLFGASLGEGTDTRPSRTVTRLEDGGRKIVHRQYVPGADGKERLMMELVMTKKAAKP